MLSQLDPPSHSCLEKAKKAYFQRNMQEAYHEAHTFLNPYLSSTFSSSLNPLCSSSPSSNPLSCSPSKQDLSTAWSIYFTSKLALGHTLTWTELEQHGDPTLYPLLLQSPPTDPLSLLNKLAILIPFLPIHSHSSLYQQVSELLEQITVEEAFTFLDQASFLPLSFKEEFKEKCQLKKQMSANDSSSLIYTPSSSHSSSPFLFSFLNRCAHFSRWVFYFLSRKQLYFKPYWKSIAFFFIIVFGWKKKTLFYKWISLLIQS